MFLVWKEERKLESFSVGNHSFKKTGEIVFQDQCVEVTGDENYIYCSTTNFKHPPELLRNKVWIVDAQENKIISSVYTGGNWSKVIVVNSRFNEILVSNWDSHGISVIDINDVRYPSLKQVVKWGEAPRGIGLLPDGNEALIAGFYSRNLGILKRDKSGHWKVMYTSTIYDCPNYGGNMRDVVILNDGRFAAISNMGRNLLLFWDVENRSFSHVIPVGKSPNSVCRLGSTDILAVSCRESRAIYFVNIKKYSLIGCSEQTSEDPTGLCSLGDGRFLSTSFGGNMLELHELKRGYLKNLI